MDGMRSHDLAGLCIFFGSFKGNLAVLRNSGMAVSDSEFGNRLFYKVAIRANFPSSKRNLLDSARPISSLQTGRRRFGIAESNAWAD